jgi:peptide chain release factor 1
VTDHRINFKTNRLDEVLHGNLDEIITALVSERQAELLTEFGIAQ